MPLIVEGLDDLRKAVRRLKDSEVDDAMKGANERLARAIVDLAEPNVRVRSGKLLRSLRAAGTKRDAIGRVGSKSVPYAAAIHWKYGPPFLTNAAAQIEQHVADDYDRELAEVANRLIGH